MCSECGERWAKYKPGLCQPCYRRARAGAEHRPGICAQCGEPFMSKRRYSAESGRNIYCSRKCKEAARSASGRAAESGRKHYYKTRYGLTLEEVKAIRAAGCAICGAKEGGGRHGQLHIDHCHKTGKIRGALCDACNLGLGKFRDDPGLLLKAAEYLRA